MDSYERRYGQWPNRFDRMRWQQMMQISHSVCLKKRREEEEAAATIHHHLGQHTVTAATGGSRKGVDTDDTPATCGPTYSSALVSPLRLHPDASRPESSSSRDNPRGTMAVQFSSRDNARCDVTASDEPDVRCPTDSVRTANPSKNGFVPTSGTGMSFGSGVCTNYHSHTTATFGDTTELASRADSKAGVSFGRGVCTNSHSHNYHYNFWQYHGIGIHGKFCQAAQRS